MLLGYYDINLIRDYESDSPSSQGTNNAGGPDLDNSCTPGNCNEEINVRSVRKVYLITYSQANVVRFLTRHSFVRAVFMIHQPKSCTGPAAWKNILTSEEVIFTWP